MARAVGTLSIEQANQRRGKIAAADPRAMSDAAIATRAGAVAPSVIHDKQINPETLGLRTNKQIGAMSLS
jgi:hypothetical protein